MGRGFRGWHRLGGGRYAVHRVAGLILLGVLGVLGARAIFPRPSDTQPAPPSPPGTDWLGVSDAGAFRQMRPRAGDKMTLPRIGFRWTWVPDSARAAVPAKQVKFRVHLISSAGTHEVTRQAAEPRAYVNLGDDFPIGECQWWVEAVVPGLPPVRGGRETFLLER